MGGAGGEAPRRSKMDREQHAVCRGRRPKTGRFGGRSPPITYLGGGHYPWKPKMEKIWAPKYWLIQKIWTITTVSIAAQISTFPLGLLYFHQFPNYFLISNLVVIPAAFLILSLGILIIVLSFSKIIVGFISYLLHYLD